MKVRELLVALLPVTSNSNNDCHLADQPQATFSSISAKLLPEIKPIGPTSMTSLDRFLKSQRVHAIDPKDVANVVEATQWPNATISRQNAQHAKAIIRHGTPMPRALKKVNGEPWKFAAVGRSCSFLSKSAKSQRDESCLSEIYIFPISQTSSIS